MMCFSGPMGLRMVIASFFCSAQKRQSSAISNNFINISGIVHPPILQSDIEENLIQSIIHIFLHFTIFVKIIIKFRSGFVSGFSIQPKALFAEDSKETLDHKVSIRERIDKNGV